MDDSFGEFIFFPVYSHFRKLGTGYENQVNKYDKKSFFPHFRFFIV